MDFKRNLHIICRDNATNRPHLAACLHCCGNYTVQAPAKEVNFTKHMLIILYPLSKVWHYMLMFFFLYFITLKECKYFLSSVFFSYKESMSYHFTLPGTVYVFVCLPQVCLKYRNQVLHRWCQLAPICSTFMYQMI